MQLDSIGRFVGEPGFWRVVTRVLLTPAQVRIHQVVTRVLLIPAQVRIHITSVGPSVITCTLGLGSELF